ncbi:hypothetical protein GCM10011379_52400 [Filimonas zeae]|uniref:Uncharacterized protein n=1 Tax=Filimonas zeae TaxID=1737353 RepID=A0A917MZ59_9BACT|nr:hypothetical protein GCM10011379_52400 [Filimonas zeae]
MFYTGKFTHAPTVRYFYIKIRVNVNRQKKGIGEVSLAQADPVVFTGVGSAGTYWYYHFCRGMAV